MTDAEIRALAEECGVVIFDSAAVSVPCVSGHLPELLAFGRRLIAIGRAEALEEAAQHMSEDYRPLLKRWSTWLRARAAEERAKS